MVFEAVLYRKKAGLIYRITRSCSTKGKFYRLCLIFSEFFRTVDKNVKIYKLYGIQRPKLESPTITENGNYMML